MRPGEWKLHQAVYFKSSQLHAMQWYRLYRIDCVGPKRPLASEIITLLFSCVVSFTSICSSARTVITENSIEQADLCNIMSQPLSVEFMKYSSMRMSRKAGRNYSLQEIFV